PVFFISFFVFFFQAEDGIRDFHVTGVQTCALPISAAPDLFRARSSLPAECRAGSRKPSRCGSRSWGRRRSPRPCRAATPSSRRRSEERRVGKECRALRATEL